MSKTTIQLSQSTKADLDECKRADGESYDSVVARLASDNGDAALTEARVREIAREELREGVVPEARDA